MICDEMNDVLAIRIPYFIQIYHAFERLGFGGRSGSSKHGSLRSKVSFASYLRSSTQLATSPLPHTFAVQLVFVTMSKFSSSISSDVLSAEIFLYSVL